MDEQVRRLADQVHETIRRNDDEFLRAEGTAVLTVFRRYGSARVELTSSKTLVGISGQHRSASHQRLPVEVHQLADDVRQAMLSDHLLVGGARQIVIEIQLRGPRPSFDISYKGRRP